MSFSRSILSALLWSQNSVRLLRLVSSFRVRCKCVIGFSSVRPVLAGFEDFSAGLLSGHCPALFNRHFESDEIGVEDCFVSVPNSAVEFAAHDPPVAPRICCVCGPKTEARQPVASARADEVMEVRSTTSSSPAPVTAVVVTWELVALLLSEVPFVDVVCSVSLH